MPTKREELFHQKEARYLAERKQLQQRMEQILDEKKEFIQYLDHLATKWSSPAPCYDVAPEREVFYRLLANSKEEADLLTRKEYLAVARQLEEKQQAFQKECVFYEETKKNSERGVKDVRRNTKVVRKTNDSSFSRKS